MTVWEAARRWLRGRRGEDVSVPVPVETGPALRRARSLCVAGGKGGTGKSTVSAALAAGLARTGRVLLVDGDLGMGNAHLLQDAVPRWTLVDVVHGRVGAREALVPCGPGLDLLAGGSGYSRVANLEPSELARLAAGVGSLEGDYDWLLVDAAAGISRQTLELAAACDRVLLVTTPDVTALTDAYAFLKVFLAQGARRMPELVLNRERTREEGDEALRRIADTARRFLGVELWSVARLPEDDAARLALRRREPVPVAAPSSELARALERLVGELELQEDEPVDTTWGERLLRGLAARSSTGAGG